MKIVTWNCNMAFRKKAAHVLAHNPDILIIPECEHPEKLIFPPYVQKPTSTQWVGYNNNKGLGILSYNKYRLEVLETHNRNLQLIIPIAIKKGKWQCVLLAIWANNPSDKEGRYVEQIWKALHCYEKLLSRKRVILAGDFNSNTIWDRPRRVGNHSHVVDFLAKRRITSTYHAYFDQVQGKEQHPTQYMYRHVNKSYHLDYCFASSYFIKRMKSVEIGEHQHWSPHSDHMPVIVTFDDH